MMNTQTREKTRHPAQEEEEVEEEKKKQQLKTHLTTMVLDIIADHQFGATIGAILAEAKAHVRRPDDITTSDIVAALNYLIGKKLIKCSDKYVRELPHLLTDSDYKLLFYTARAESGP